MDVAGPYIDSSSYAHAVVAYPSDPNVPLDTVLFQFGPGSATFPFGASTLTIADAPEFDFSTATEWTVEMWVQPNAGHDGFSPRPILNKRMPGIADVPPFRLELDGSNTLLVSGSGPSTSYAFTGPVLTSGTPWIIELDRHGNTMTLRVNGVTTNTGTISGALGNPAQPIEIGGMIGEGNNFGGNIDELRFTIGVQRYTGDYTPAVVPFGGLCSFIPNVVGLTQAAATTAITGGGFTLGTVTTAHDPIVPFGYVISQNPAAGTPEAPGFPVDILVSLGIALVTVPNVVGLTLAAATAALTGVGLIVGTLSTGPSFQPIGRITAELPTAGTVVAAGSAINLVQSNGLVPVPNVVGEQLIVAENQITAAGLTVGPITAEQLSGITPGTVNGQSPAAGTGVLPGTAVSLTSVSAITTAFDIGPTVISQYANSPTLLRLVENMAQYIDPSADFLNFFSFVWNVDTAVGFGLDIWGRIVGVSRVLPISGALHDFGFHNSDSPPDWEPFNQGPFFNGNANTGAYTLPDDAYRTLILTKALANITATNAQALNQLVRNLFPGRGKCFVQDLGGMAMSYVFEFTLTSIEYAILTQSGVLPHPAGVLVNVFVVPGTSFVGFSEAGAGLYQPFGYGQFYIPGE